MLTGTQATASPAQSQAQSAQPAAPTATEGANLAAQATEAKDGQADAAQAEAGKAPTDDMSARFAALSRQEKKFQDEKRKAKELSEKYSPFDEAISQKDALKLLERAGFSINDVIDAALKQDHVPTTDEKLLTVEQKLAAFEKAREDERLAKEQAAQQEVFDREVSAFKETLNQTLTSEGDRFELINASGGADTVYEACFKIVTEDPDSYPTRAEVEAMIPRVADMIEGQLQESLKKLTGAKKLKALLGSADALSGAGNANGSGSTAPTQASSSRPAEASSKQDITLTNKNAVNPAQPETKPKRLTPDESKARAAKWLDEQLRAREQAVKNGLQ